MTASELIELLHYMIENVGDCTVNVEQLTYNNHTINATIK